MQQVTPEMRERFLEFLAVYEAARSKLIEEGAAGPDPKIGPPTKRS